MTAALGVNIVSPERPDWPEQIRRLQLAEVELLKCQIPAGFGTSAAQLEQALDALPSVRVLILRGEDGDPTYARTKQDLIGRGFIDVIRDRPNLRVIIELGNEPDHPDRDVPIDWYRSQAFTTIRLLRAEVIAQYGLSHLIWTVSLPMTLPNVERIFAGGEYENTCDAIATHLYGHHYLLDPGDIGDDYTHLPTEWEHIYGWLHANTRLPLWITECGINDAETDDTEKVERYLAFAESAPERLQGVALWASVSDDQREWIRNYALDTAALKRLGERKEPAMPVTPNSPFRNITRISMGKFSAWLRANANPGVVAERNPDEYWHQCRRDRIDPLLMLAKFNHESSAGKAGVAITTHSWGNTRAPNFGAEPVGSIPGRTGEFPVWENWMDGLKSTTARLNASNYPEEGPYGQRHQIIEIYDHPSDRVWAPAGDLNDPDAYLASIVRFMNTHMDMEEIGGDPPQPPPPDFELIDSGYYGLRRVQGLFRLRWNDRGREGNDGKPITDELGEVLDDGAQHVVQYFERDRYELHGGDVLHGRIGAELLQVRTESAALELQRQQLQAILDAGGEGGIPPEEYAERIGVIIADLETLATQLEDTAPLLALALERARQPLGEGV